MHFLVRKPCLKPGFHQVHNKLITIEFVIAGREFTIFIEYLVEIKEALIWVLYIHSYFYFQGRILDCGNRPCSRQPCGDTIQSQPWIIMRIRAASLQKPRTSDGGRYDYQLAVDISADNHQLSVDKRQVVISFPWIKGG